MSLGTLLYTWLKGELVGKDSFGNRYFRERKKRKLVKGAGMESRERRWVMYNGIVEASKVPAEWHCWLHHTTDIPPTAADPNRRPWQKEHLPNLTGTNLAYRPKGSLLRSGKYAKTAGEYEAWTP